MSENGSRSAGRVVATASGRASLGAPEWRAIALLGALWAALGGFGPAHAADAYSADAVKAEFLYRFAGYVEWPADLPDDAPFTIAVAAADGVFNELRQRTPGRTIQNHRVEIRKVLAKSDLEHVQILYVPTRAQSSSRELLAAAVGRPILVVTDEAGALEKGSIVNFLLVDRHVRFEISLTSAERSRLRINSGLLSVAAHVEGVRPRAEACWPALAFGLTPGCAQRAAFANLTRVDVKTQAVAVAPARES